MQFSIFSKSRHPINFVLSRDEQIPSQSAADTRQGLNKKIQVKAKGRLRRTGSWGVERLRYVQEMGKQWG